MTLRSLWMVLLVAFASQAFSQAREEGRQASPYGTERTDAYQDIKIFPNPAPEYVNVQLGSLNAKDVRLSVLNVIGSELNPEVETINEHEMRVRVKDMAPGYYFLTVKDENSKFKGIYKFLKP
ncbi:MAG TPA: T9SS type A sorting domain-containing protein [Cyclobacteriaceae bacterium]|nr:T9SS type A sorting domain-containing protein [Cyclobacteriaceae bacterium]